MELPVRPKDSWEIIDANGERICLTDTTEDRDSIVQALNGREKLKAILEEIEAVSCGEKQVAEDDSEGMGWIYKRIQALKGE